MGRSRSRSRSRDRGRGAEDDDGRRSKRDRDRDRDRDRREKKKKSKKEKKEKKAKEPKLYQMVGYTNEENPFGDHNLNQQFVWKKKGEKDGTDMNSLSKREKHQRQEHFLEEIQKVRQRRIDREEEQEEQERLRAEESRLREAEQYADWHKKEEDFHLEQARVRSKIRLVEGREKPIDVLAKNIILLGSDEDDMTGARKEMADTSQLEVELREPHTVFQGLALAELRELMNDIKTYQELEGGGPNLGFWKALAVVCKKEIQTVSVASGDQPSRRSGIHSSVMEELTEKFSRNSSAELDQTRADIQSKISSNDGTLDVEFWEAVLTELQVYRAKAELREFHQGMLKRQLERLEERQAALRRYREEHPEEAAQEAAASKAAAAAEDKGEVDTSAAASAMHRAEAAKGLGDLEEELGLTDEVRVKDQVYWWQDKYRPRKPRYFNRVKTGYDWNKYNQTHYDHDNPPPKTVQGYKFTVFYPDLIDRTKTPRYILEPSDTKEFCILRFTAGPPYEDVAFKLVNREWEFGRKAGFRCVFERGILHLYFNFKRHRYRK